MNLRAHLALLLVVTGCSGLDRGGNWPSLATRPGEQGSSLGQPLAPTCAGCGQDVLAAAKAAVPDSPPPVSADIAQRLSRVDQAIATVERQVPAQRNIAMAAPEGAEAEVQRSRYESLFLPLAEQDSALDRIEDDLAGKAGAESALAAAAALRVRLAVLSQLRTLP